MALFIRYITYNGTRYSYSSFEQRTRSSSLRDYSITLKSAFPKNGAFYLIKNSSFDFDDANSLSAPSSSDVMDVADIADMPYNYTPSDKATIRSDYANRRRVRYTYSSDAVQERSNNKFRYVNKGDGTVLPLSFSRSGCRPIAGYSDASVINRKFCKNWYIDSAFEGDRTTVTIYSDRYVKSVYNRITGETSSPTTVYFGKTIRYMYIFAQASTECGGVGGDGGRRGAPSGGGGACVALLRFPNSSMYYTVTGIYGGWYYGSGDQGEAKDLVIECSYGGEIIVPTGKRSGKESPVQADMSGSYYTSVWSIPSKVAGNDFEAKTVPMQSIDDLYNIRFNSHFHGKDNDAKGGGASCVADGGAGGSTDGAGYSGSYGSGSGGGGHASFGNHFTHWGGVTCYGGWNGFNFIVLGY